MLIPADKAANNVIAVGKEYYVEVVTREIMATTTYEPIARADISEHQKFMKNNCITVNPELELPKVHKQPYHNRFIAACTTKSLLRLLTCCL